MTDTPIYGQTAAQFNPAPVNQPDPNAPSLESQVEALVAARLSEAEAKHEARIEQLEAQLKAATARVPVHVVTEHAAGPGYETAGTWSMWHQELARAGKLTPEILAAAGIE